MNECIDPVKEHQPILYLLPETRLSLGLPSVQLGLSSYFRFEITFCAYMEQCAQGIATVTTSTSATSPRTSKTLFMDDTSNHIQVRSIVPC